MGEGVTGRGGISRRGGEIPGFVVLTLRGGGSTVDPETAFGFARRVETPIPNCLEPQRTCRPSTLHRTRTSPITLSSMPPSIPPPYPCA
jgi:hypothetical protein